MQKEHEEPAAGAADYAGGDPGVQVRQDNGHDNVALDIESTGGGKRPLHPDRYRIKIDHQHYVVEQRLITGRELLLLAQKNPPEKWEIEKRMHGGDYVPVELDQMVDLAEPGLEAFETFPLDETEG